MLNSSRILGMRAIPWSPDGSDNAFHIQVGMERPAEMVPRSPGEVLIRNKVARTRLRRADFDQWGLSAHSEARRRRTESLLDPHDWLRPTKESIVHWPSRRRTG